MQRLLTTVLTIAVIFAALAFVGAPFYGFFALRAAARDQDVQALAELVDYDAVRSSLRPQLGGASNAVPPSVWQDPIGALKHAIEPLQPAHQNSWSSGRRVVAATQSAAHAACAIVEENSAASGLRIVVSASSCQVGSSSVT